MTDEDFHKKSRLLEKIGWWLATAFFLISILVATSLSGSSIPKEGSLVGFVASNLLHLFGFGLFACSLYSAALKTNLKPKYCLVAVIGAAFFFAVGTEIHQRSIPGRDSSLSDVLIDILGALIGLASAYKYWRLAQVKGGRNQ